MNMKKVLFVFYNSTKIHGSVHIEVYVILLVFMRLVINKMK